MEQQEKASNNAVTMYTDGASRGNPGPGGYGTILIAGSRRKEFSQGYRHTTNNRMELMAVIAGLKALKRHGLNVTIFSDSQYIVNAIKKGWLENWMKTNFKGGKKNKDLWVQYYDLAMDQHIQVLWVKGHGNNPFNNRCDLLATAAADGNNLIEDEGFKG